MSKKSTRDLERRQRIEQLRQEQARKEKTRSLLILGGCVVVVVGLLAAALVPYLKDRAQSEALASKDVAAIGLSPKAASCDAIITRKTDHSQEHVPAPKAISYPDSPPSFGAHRPTAAPFERTFYTAADRPEIPELVHNLEHGYVIAWYDDTLAKDKGQLDELKAIGRKYQSEQTRFIAAPWTGEDGKAFPSGKHLALTRWSADAKDPGNQSKQRGNWEYCGQTSGKAISEFVAKWPNAESPEPGIM